MRKNKHKADAPGHVTPEVHCLRSATDRGMGMMEYDVQATCDTDNVYPLCAQGLPRDWERHIPQQKKEK